MECEVALLVVLLILFLQISKSSKSTAFSFRFFTYVFVATHLQRLVTRPATGYGLKRQTDVEPEDFLLETNRKNSSPL